MKTLILTCVALATITVFGSQSGTAQARDFALHFSGPGYHVDVGRPVYRDVYYGGYYGDRGYYSGDGFYGGRHFWHDTSHYDYHPGEFIRHGYHYHYVPGHYDYHPDGHWDHHGW